MIFLYKNLFFFAMRVEQVLFIFGDLKATLISTCIYMRFALGLF